MAALLPVDANEVDLAAHCIAARAQAEDILRLIRQHAGDIALVTRLNAQYGSMVRTSLSVHGRLMRVQALRRKRETIEGAADQDTWARDIAELSMVRVVYQDATPQQEASPERARPMSREGARTVSPERASAASPEVAPVKTRPQSPTGTSAHVVNQRIEKIPSEFETNSQHAAFETWLSEQPWNQGSTGPDDTARRIVREAMATARNADPALTANSRESRSMAG